MNKKQKKMLTRIGMCIAALILLTLTPLAGLPQLIGYLAVYLLIGYDILKKAARGILNRQVFDENFLMSVATIGAFSLALYEQNGEYLEAIAVMLFYQIGELFQSYAVGKSRKNIQQLMDIRPDYANVEVNGKMEKVDPESVHIGTKIFIQPGEKVPLDGIVLTGNSTLNTAALTGESAPHDISPGDEILSGCINMSERLTVQTTKEFGASTVSKILELVENSSSRKSKSENFISKFAKIYTPIVCYSALALATLPPIVQLILGATPQWDSWIYRALTFLVISCPCALVVSVPLSFFAGIGGASKEGILIKGSNYLETLAQVKYIVFDKTGTLTQGVFEVKDIHHNTLEKEALLEYSALAESSSAHPIAKSLLRAYGKEIDAQRIHHVEEISGQGIIARVDNTDIAIGNGKLMKNLGIVEKKCHAVGTILHVALNGVYAGHIVISDKIKSHAKEALAKLKASGIVKTVMLTGDRKAVAETIAAQLGIDEVHSELLPAEKVEKVEQLLATKSPRQKLAFVGDGINDAPVLMRADIGIAMGAMGSDAAIEAADIVLMDDEPLQISKAINISRKCMAIVYQNILFALSVKFICLGLGAAGFANMWLAIFADVGVTVLAVLNATRALRVHNL